VAQTGSLRGWNGARQLPPTRFSVVFELQSVGIVRHDRPLGRDIPGSVYSTSVGRTARPLELSWAPRRSRAPPLTAILVIHGLPRRELSCSPSTDDLSRATRSRARGAARFTDRAPRQVLEPLHRMPESETEVVLQQNDAGRGIYSEFAAEAAQCSRCMGFSSRRSRWRLSVMRRDRDWGGASAASGMPSFGRRPAMTRILSGFRRQRPSGSRRIRRRSARGPEGQPEAPGVGSRRPNHGKSDSENPPPLERRSF
jgi:hypothetical protein